MRFNGISRRSACKYLHVISYLYLGLCLWISLTLYNYNLSVRCLTAYHGDLVFCVRPSLPFPGIGVGAEGCTWRHIKEQKKESCMVLERSTSLGGRGPSLNLLLT